MKKKEMVLLLIILFSYIVIPICILLFDCLFNIKFIILTIIGLLIFLLFKLLKIPNYYLGITKGNLDISIKRNILLIVILIIIILIAKLFSFDRYNPNESMMFYLFYIFISCPIQEFLYRGVFGYFEKKINFRWLWAVVSSACFAFAHIIYKDYLTCIFTFILGIIWYQLYRKDYNLCGVVLSHIILGILTISLGIIN